MTCSKLSHEEYGITGDIMRRTKCVVTCDELQLLLFGFVQASKELHSLARAALIRAKCRISSLTSLLVLEQYDILFLVLEPCRPLKPETLFQK